MNLAASDRLTPRDDIALLVYVRAGGTTGIALVSEPDDEALTPEAAISRRWPGAVMLQPDRVAVARITAHVNALLAVSAAPANADRAPAGEISLFTGSAFSGGREVALADGEFAVAAAMAMSRRARSREEWCDVLWPGRDAESAARLLKVYVHRIRTKFGFAGIIETHGHAYRLGRDVAVDLESLEALARTQGARELNSRALRSVRRAFAGFETQRYARPGLLESNAELERRLVATGVELGRILAHDALRRADHQRALAIAEYLTALDPYDEVAAELLIRTQIVLGRHDAAARSFRSFCRTLHDELDLPPPPHLRRFFETTAP